MFRTNKFINSRSLL